MDGMIVSLINWFFENGSRYIQVVLEEFGRFIDMPESVYHFLIRSFDSGVDTQFVNEFLDQLGQFKVRNFRMISFGQDQQVVLRCEDGGIFMDMPEKETGYGTSISFEFSYFDILPYTLFEVFGKEFFDRVALEFRALSKFRDLSEVEIVVGIENNSCDFRKVAIDSLVGIVQKSLKLQEKVAEMFNYDTGQLYRILMDSFYP
ncbi:hypothetical protein SteCoe_20795 [Stentor coeruleus]|uniref:Uncharacterized protein n=1 Tax=Stentor coeruleus TaxID=5963 RepID=A0A1R2BR06_9CILI|nr:hypothetical protein SteCoe_20795 [Stentor coeruleus]